MAGYIELARRMDEAWGQILGALEASGLAENTLVVCTTDHGIGFAGMKGTLTDKGLGVMLIVRGPGGFSGGRVIEAMVQQMDIFPTLCEMLRIDPPDWLEGTSLLPLVRGEAERIHEAIFGEASYHSTYRPMRSVRTAGHKYIRRFEPEDRRGPEEELFDLAADPHEACNLAGRPELASMLDEMRRRLDAWMRQTDDPLRTGRVPCPADAILNQADEA